MGWWSLRWVWFAFTPRVFFLAVVMLLPPLRRVLLPTWAQRVLRAVPLLRGLGARGPPILL